ncbi:hypothetical protein BDV26DRAFT_255231 [Aspergillus bertholletiae]|uniref:Uncharacterized protein n=1 Tax=Aspergillus bertholletiae TaxID=1226010 RepID=A0A5N7BIP3_9EURO|nr:hypothetical protein BDV26DRAFT_255231 [Aspergillus bertholletiae]
MMVFLFTKLENQLVELLSTSPKTLKRDGERCSSIFKRIAPASNADRTERFLGGIVNYIFHYRLGMALLVEGHPTSVLPVDRGRTSKDKKEWHRRFVENTPSVRLCSQPEMRNLDLMRIWYIIAKMYVIRKPSLHQLVDEEDVGFTVQDHGFGDVLFESELAEQGLISLETSKRYGGDCTYLLI